MVLVLLDHGGLFYSKYLLLVCVNAVIVLNLTYFPHEIINIFFRTV